MNTSKQVKIGLIIVLSFAALYWGINFLKGRDVFDSNNSYTIIYDKVDGLTKSSSVLLRGYKIGQVSSISFTSSKHESLTVEISIEKNIYLPKGTIAHIFSSDLMGTKSIELLLGDSETILYSGDTLLPKIEESLSDQVKLQMLPLKKKTENMITSVETAIEAMKSVFNKKTGMELRRSLEKVQLAIDAIQSSSSSLDTILTDGQTKIGNILKNVEDISANLNKNNDKVTTIITNFATISDSLAKANIASTLINAENSLGQLDTMLTRMNQGAGTAGKFLQDSSLYLSLDDATKSLNELLIDINENPARYVHISLIDLSRSSKKKDKKNVEIISE